MIDPAERLAHDHAGAPSNGGGLAGVERAQAAEASLRMADLLECLIQVGALSETTRRLVAAVYDRWEDSRPHQPAANADGVAEALLFHSAHERVCRDSLVRALPSGPALAPTSTALRVDAQSILGAKLESLPAAWRDQLLAFLALRVENLEAVGRCSAADLSAAAPYPGRGSTTVADLVAIMLASDTDMIGRVRRAAATGFGDSSDRTSAN